LAMSFQIFPVRAASLTILSDEMTRLAAGVAADHVITFTLPGGIDFDAGGAGAADDDQFNIGFDPTTTAFGLGAGWAESDFAIKNATTNHAWVPWNIQEGIGAVPDCTGATTDDVAVAVDTDLEVFRFEACEGSGGFTATGFGHKIEITILGASGGTTLTNPAAADFYIVENFMDDESSRGAHSGLLAVAIIDSDQVTINADVDPTLTFDIDVSLTDSETGEPYEVNLGTLTKSAVKTSNNTTIKSIWVDLETNADGGAVVTIVGAYGGLQSNAIAHTIGGVDTTLVPGAEGTGVCLSYVAGLTGVAPYQSGNCGGTKHTVGKVNTTATDILNTGGNPTAGGRAEIMVKASISAVTPAASDYTDTFTFNATATF